MDSPRLLALLPALSPFVALNAFLAAPAFHGMLIPGMVLMLLVAWRRQWFCRWLCPVGLCMDGASALGRRWGRRGLRWGRWGDGLVFVTFGGALLGWPLFLWLDPLSLFAGAIQSDVSHPAPGLWIPAALFLAFFFFNVIWPHLWCGRVCPLGAFQAICYDGVDSFRKRLTHKKSEVKKADGAPVRNVRFSRRAALGVGAGVCLAGMTGRLRAKGASPIVRPPGALDEARFVGVCARCGNCLQICPAHVIELDRGASGLAGWLTPRLTFQQDYCREDCVRCGDACPSGALRRLTPEEKLTSPVGLARVDMDWCLLREDLECTKCAQWCPHGAIRYVFDDTTYNTTPTIEPEKCSGCGACERVCPTRPVRAITIGSPGP